VSLLSADARFRSVILALLAELLVDLPLDSRTAPTLLFFPSFPEPVVSRLVAAFVSSISTVASPALVGTRAWAMNFVMTASSLTHEETDS
jgi:hypothetical protein